MTLFAKMIFKRHRLENKVNPLCGSKVGVRSRGPRAKASGLALDHPDRDHTLHSSRIL